MSMSFDLLDEDATFIKSLSGLTTADQGGVLGWTHMRRNVGAGTLTIPNDHPDFAALYRGRIIRCNLDGSPTGFSWILRDENEVRLNDGTSGRGGQVTVWQGPGIKAYLGTNGWHAAIIEGRGDSGLMTLGWVVTGWDTSLWTDPFSFGQQQDPDSRIPVLAGSPPNWPDPQSEWLWTRDLTEGSSRKWHQAGVCYFRRTLRGADRSYTGPARVFISATNRWDCWFDEQHAAEGSGHADVQQFDVEFEAGEDYTIGLRVMKDLHPEWNVTPGLVNVTIITLTGEGELGAVLYRTYTDAYQSSPAAGPWKVLDYQEPVGLTWARVAVRTIDEAKNDRGAIPGVTVDPSFTLDSDGVAWTEAMPLLSYRDGEQVGDVLNQAAQQFACEWDMADDLVVRAWESRGSDLSASIHLSDATPDVARALRTSSGDKANTGRVEVDGEYGWHGTPAAGAIRRETAVTMGLAISVEEVQIAVEQALQARRGRERQVLLSKGPAGSRPYLNFGIADAVGVRSTTGGAYEPWECEAITVRDRPGGTVHFELDMERDVADA